MKRWTLGVVGAASLLLACSPSSKCPEAANDSGCGSSGAPAGMANAGNGNAGAPGNATSAGSAGTGGQGNAAGGATTMGVGDGELDASCPSRTSNHVGGKRIILRNAVTAEGDKAFIGFYDTEQQTECRVIQDAEGKYRCMPLASDKDMRNRFYLDDACSKEVEYRGICSLDLTAVPVSEDACDGRRRIYKPGKSLSDAVVYAKTSDGGCKSYGTLNHLYERGEEIAAADYAEVKPATWRGKGRIWAQGYEGTDDLRIVTTFIDSQLDEACRFERLSDGSEHCVPWHQASIDYTDESCGKVLLDTTGSCGTHARYFGTPSRDSCKPGTDYFKADAAFAGTAYERGTCTMAATDAPKVLYTPTAVPSTDFAAVESTIANADAGRLKPIYRTATDGGCSFEDWWDDMLQTACSFATLDGGQTYYCLPNADRTWRAVTLEGFSDPECKTTAVYVEVPGCDGAKPPTYSVTDKPSCAVGQRTIRKVDATAITLPTFFMQSDGGCKAYTPDATATYYRVGAVVDNDSFVKATPEP